MLFLHHVFLSEQIKVMMMMMSFCSLKYKAVFLHGYYEDVVTDIILPRWHVCWRTTIDFNPL